MWKKAKWIGLPEEEIREKQIYQGDMNGRFVYFRHSFTLGEDMVSFGKAGRRFMSSIKNRRCLPSIFYVL